MAADSLVVGGGSKEDYLKKYLSDPKKDKRKKKKHKAKSATGRTKIVDDDVDLEKVINESNKKEPSLFDEDDPEDCPQVAGVVDDRPAIVQKLELFKNASKWRTLDDGIKKEITSSAENSPREGGRKRHDSDSGPDQSPPRRKARHDSDQDISPPRKRQDNSDHDRSSSRQRRQSYEDNSPPRRQRHDSDQDISPPRKRRHDSDEDQSPPRRRRNSDDQSPPRRKDMRHNVDSSRRRYNSSHDQSPSRRHRNDSGQDQSPPRRRPNDSKRDQSPPRRRQRSPSLERGPPGGRRDKTLDGKKAGLQHARALAEESKEIKRMEAKMFSELGDEKSGRKAQTILRRKGKKVDLEAEKRKKQEQEAQDAELAQKYAKWSRGVKQIENQTANAEEAMKEMSKPLARYADDEDLDQHLRAQERIEDPMLEYINRKKAQKAGTNPGRPTYKGPLPMPNRFAILPGYRWDGVDRSNGYEKQWLLQQNNRKATEEDAYKWSVADM